MGNSPDICQRHYAALIPEKMTDVVEFVAKAGKLTETDGPEMKLLLKQILLKVEGLGEEEPKPRLRLVRNSDPA